MDSACEVGFEIFMFRHIQTIAPLGQRVGCKFVTLAEWETKIDLGQPHHHATDEPELEDREEQVAAR